MGVKSSRIFFLLAFVATCLIIVGCSGNNSETNTSPAAKISPSPSASPAVGKLSSTDAIEAFKSAGLEVASTHPVEKSTDPNSLEIEGTAFSISSAGKQADGRVFSYVNAANARKMEDLYDRVAEQVSAQMKSSFYWSFAHDNLLVQISRTIPKKKAQLYSDAVQAISKSNPYSNQ